MNKKCNWFRVIFLGLLAIGLAGCNLETKKPLFTEAESKLLLADYPNLVAYERDDGGWKKSDDPLNVAPEGSHYLVTLGNSEMRVSFVPLDGPWWILQATEAASASYVLVKAEPRELLVSPLDCKSLKEAGTYDSAVDFVDSDCFIKDGANVMALFKSFTANPTEPSTKLVSGP